MFRPSGKIQKIQKIKKTYHVEDPGSQLVDYTTTILRSLAIGWWNWVSVGFVNDPSPRRKSDIRRRIPLFLREARHSECCESLPLPRSRMAREQVALLSRSACLYTEFLLLDSADGQARCDLKNDFSGREN